MDIKSLILKKIIDKGEVRVADIIKATGFSRAYLNRFFKELREERKIVLLGRANQARYVLAKAKIVREAKKQVLSFRRVLENKDIAEDIILDEVQKNTGVFIGLPKNVAQILNYAFTEMLNNAIEHSRSRIIEVSMKKNEGIVRFDVIDRGVGIFNNIMKKRKLKNELEAIQDLMKGKQTTAPKEHSGEGIFFTSKAGDILTIQSSNKKLVFDNILDDVFIKDIRNFKGTKIVFTIGSNSKRNLGGIFRQYSDDLFEFSKTKVTVKLYKLDTGYISRSQARRIVGGLEKFKTVTLDFAKVSTVGQGFTDEVFRVWKSRHPNIDIQYENANENVDFMIKRALA
jgi:anti-sigma regulatory factor (Ser/Thr protein kinase)